MEYTIRKDPMKISDYVEQLENVKSTYGNLEVVVPNSGGGIVSGARGPKIEHWPTSSGYDPCTTVPRRGATWWCG